MSRITALEFSNANLTRLFQRVPVRSLTGEDRIVIFSDLHMGDGSRQDDFVDNAEMFQVALRGHYGPGGYHLILNGDVEDLQRFPMRAIVRRWSAVYQAVGVVADAGGLTRIVGNHDLDLLEGGPAVSAIAMYGARDWPETYIDRVAEGVRFRHSSGELFVFHGHQTSRWYEKHNNVIRWILRYLANPLHISNSTVAADSHKRFRTERRVYDFASRNKVLTIIGHTHRPLFESMSKSDSIQFEIERLCREYPASEDQEEIESRIAWLKEELMELSNDTLATERTTSLYQDHLMVPTMFNSGCVLGKRGMTCIELEDGLIRLVYWFDTSIKQKHLQYRSANDTRLAGTRFSRIVIKEDSLDYVFSRIRLLS